MFICVLCNAKLTINMYCNTKLTINMHCNAKLTINMQLPPPYIIDNYNNISSRSILHQ
jgi:hypothetical protein